MTEKFSRWDSAQHLNTEEDSEDPAWIAHTLGVVARARNMSQLARDVGMSREGLYKAMSPDGHPDPAHPR